MKTCQGHRTIELLSNSFQLLFLDNVELVFKAEMALEGLFCLSGIVTVFLALKRSNLFTINTFMWMQTMIILTKTSCKLYSGWHDHNDLIAIMLQ